MLHRNGATKPAATEALLGTREAISRRHIRRFGAGLRQEELPKEPPLLYLPLNTSNMGTGPPLVTTEGITPFHLSTAVL